MPLDRGIIDLQLQALGESRWWDERELRDLPAVLQGDERILAISRGKVARLRWLRRSWLIVVTDKRLLCLRSGALSSWRQLELPAGRITRVALRIGPFHGRVLVVADSRAIRLLVPREDAYKLANVLSTLGTSASEAVVGFRPTRMVRRVMDHVLALPAAAFNPEEPRRSLPVPPNAAEQRLASLEEEVQELRRQIDFLEQLLRQRHAAS